MGGKVAGDQECGKPRSMSRLSQQIIATCRHFSPSGSSGAWHCFKGAWLQGRLPAFFFFALAGAFAALGLVEPGTASAAAKAGRGR